MRRAPPAAISDVCSPRYRRREPERTLLYGIVAGHLETFLAEARANDGRGLPRYVEQELRAYLRCGILAHGFVRAECKDCGKEIAVAFSCKRRGVCPSCNARRMCSTAAHLVDRVFPDVPVRQWVLSVPYELRLLLARRADAFGALTRIFAREVLRFQQQAAGIPEARGGGVSFPQRFGGSLNLNTHVHSVFPDGVFVRKNGAGAAELVPVPPPTPADLVAICERVHARFVRWLEKRGLLLADEHESNDRPEPSCIDSCTEAALGMGNLGKVIEPAHASGAATSSSDAAATLPAPEPPRSRKGKHVGEACGFSIHAGVAVAAGNTLGRELLFRYCARPPLSLERLTALPDGRFAYRLKTPWRKDETHRIMTPTELLGRLAALVPPPRHPLIRFHGVLAPHSAWRASVVPAPRSWCNAAGSVVCAAPVRPEPVPVLPVPEAPSSQTSPRGGQTSLRGGQTSLRATARSACCDARGSGESSTRKGAVAGAPDSVVTRPCIIACASTCAPGSAPNPKSNCCTRGATKPGAAPERRDAGGARNRWWIDWATLLRRVYDVDALACPCGGRLRFVEVIDDGACAATALRAMRLPAELPIIAAARARDPTPDFDSAPLDPHVDAPPPDEFHPPPPDDDFADDFG